MVCKSINLDVNIEVDQTVRPLVLHVYQDIKNKLEIVRDKDNIL